MSESPIAPATSKAATRNFRGGGSEVTANQPITNRNIIAADSAAEPSSGQAAENDPSRSQRFRRSRRYVCTQASVAGMNGMARRYGITQADESV